MERDLFRLLAKAIERIDATFADLPACTHRTAQIVRVHLWAALHERPVDWACEPRNWPGSMRERRRGVLPDQTTVSRRTRHGGRRYLEAFLDALAKELSPTPDPQLLDLKRLDGKPLLVAAHSKDRNASWGRGAGGQAKGYKLHALWGTSPLPEAWCVTPLNIDERRMAARLLQHLEGAGYSVADGNYDSNELCVLAHLNGYQMLAPRDTPFRGLGHRRQRPARQRAIDLLEHEGFGLGTFGPALFAHRRSIETKFGNLTTGIGGLAMALPPFIRRIWRVRTWVYAKLLIYAARCLLRTKRRPNSA